MNINEQKITPECLEKAANQVEDKREEYKDVLLQLKKCLAEQRRTVKRRKFSRGHMNK